MTVQQIPNLTKEKEEKYLVLKLDDIKKLSWTDQAVLHDIANRVSKRREIEGKTENHYIVVNDKEPYADRIWDMILEGPEAWEPICYGGYNPGLKDCSLCHLTKKCFDSTYGKAPKNLPGECSR